MSHDESKRTTDLEIGLAHVQRLYEQLNEVVTKEAMRSDRLQRKVDALEQQLRAVKDKSTEQPGSLEDEKPPHY